MSDFGWGSQRDRDALDRYITGNYGEDQLRNLDESDMPDICGAPTTEPEDGEDSMCARPFPCAKHPLAVQR